MFLSLPRADLLPDDVRDAPPGPIGNPIGITHLEDARAYSPQHTSAIVTG